MNGKRYFLDTNAIVQLLAGNPEVAATHVALDLFGGQAWLAFADRGGGQTLPRRNRGFWITDKKEMESLIRRDFYFRDPEDRSDHYNIVDLTGQWLVVFSHKNCWYAFHRDRDAIKKLKSLVSREERRKAEKVKAEWKSRLRHPPGLLLDDE